MYPVTHNSIVFSGFRVQNTEGIVAVWNASHSCLSLSFMLSMKYPDELRSSLLGKSSIVLLLHRRFLS